MNEKLLSEHKDSLVELSHIANCLNKVSYFDDWDASMKKECEKFSKIKYFTNEEIIFQNDSNTSQFVHFILEGKARAVQVIQLETLKNRNIMNEKNRSDVYFIEAAAAKAKRSKSARLHFRAAVRLAYQNHYWLEDTEGEQLGMNVAKNIQILTRKKPKGQFSLTEKAMMKVSQEKRTEAEKHHLRRVLGTMKCFRKYPSEVKKELAAITYYAEYDADRMIVRQGDEALALYFVISGTARVLNSKFDPLTDQTAQVVVKVKEAGDVFGELALLIGAKRSATIITNERSEFLIVKREDFDRVLRDTVSKEWNEIKKSINKFEYFKMWDDRYIQQSCMVSKMRYYEEQSLILGEDHGDQRYVYFLIEGAVDLLECVEMKVTTFRNKKTYSLFNPFQMAPIQRGRSLTVDLGKLLKDRLETEKSMSEMKLTAPQSMRFSFGSTENQDLSDSSMKLGYSDETEATQSHRKRQRKQSRKHSYARILNELTPAERVN